MAAIEIADYEIGKVLGVGTVGTIYRATDRRDGMPVAIKILHPTVSQDRLIRARFRREMLILDRLNHPNIVRCFGGGEEGGHLYYAMELVDGGTVKELLKFQGPFAWPVVIEIARQICSALQFAHNHGVVHRDLKPGNLFLTSEGDIKLGDFGIARDLEGSDLTANGMMVGTHAYMAPEQIAGDRTLSGKADLYALGCCLFEMLVGRTPFVGDNYQKLFEQHMRAEPPRLRDHVKDCPAELEDIICKLLAKSPDERPFNARQVQAVMLRLADTHRGDDPSDHEPVRGGGAAPDIGAGQVLHSGRDILRQKIDDRLSGHSKVEITWRDLGMMVAAIAAVIVAATFLGN